MQVVNYICSAHEPWEDPRPLPIHVSCSILLGPDWPPEAVFFISIVPWSQRWGNCDVLSFVSQFCSGKLFLPLLWDANLMGKKSRFPAIFWSRPLEPFFCKSDSWTETEGAGSFPWWCFEEIVHWFLISSFLDSSESCPYYLHTSHPNTLSLLLPLFFFFLFHWYVSLFVLQL